MGGRQKGKLPRPKGEREKVASPFEIKFSQATRPRARTHARSNETKGNDFPVGLTPQPAIFWMRLQKSTNEFHELGLNQMLARASEIEKMSCMSFDLSIFWARLEQSTK